jgi:hypothetical protein
MAPGRACILPPRARTNPSRAQPPGVFRPTDFRPHTPEPDLAARHRLSARTNSILARPKPSAAPQQARCTNQHNSDTSEPERPPAPPSRPRWLAWDGAFSSGTPLDVGDEGRRAKIREDRCHDPRRAPRRCRPARWRRVLRRAVPEGAAGPGIPRGRRLCRRCHRRPRRHRV